MNFALLAEEYASSDSSEEEDSLTGKTAPLPTSVGEGGKRLLSVESSQPSAKSVKTEHKVDKSSKKVWVDREPEGRSHKSLSLPTVSSGPSAGSASCAPSGLLKTEAAPSFTTTLKRAPIIKNKLFLPPQVLSRKPNVSTEDVAAYGSVRRKE